MISKDLLKKAGILGVSFGLMASPLAFANTTDHPSIEENQDSMVEQDPAQESSGVNMNTNESPEYTQEELETDHHTQGPNDETIGEPDSMGTTGDDAEMTPDRVIEENSQS